jgi:small subunit ribosomal protein S5
LQAVSGRNSGTFFNHRNAQELWKCVTTVSNQGRQRGRAKGLVKIKNLHKGQKLGFGPARVAFPGEFKLHRSPEIFCGFY